MSTPPPGAPYYPPPTPAPSNSGGCFKAAGITCAVLLVLGAILVFAAVRYTKNAIQHGTGIFGFVGKAVKASQQGQRLRQAVVRYHQINGRYPSDLMTLVSGGTVDGKDLHSDLDSDPNPGHISWTYTKPPEGAPGGTPILQLHYRITIPGANTVQQSQESDIIINLNGTTASNSYTHSQSHSDMPMPKL